MTLIVALVCKEGLVVASDSQATFPQSGVRTIEQKVFRLRESNIVLGGSGDVGVMQKARSRLEDISLGDLKQPIKTLRPKLKSAIIPILKESQDNYIPIPGTPPMYPVLETLFCGYTGNQYWILCISKNGSDEQHEHRGFCAIGSGEGLAHLAHQNLVHLGIRESTLETCKVVAYRVVDTAIATAAYGLGPPVQMWVIKEQDIKQIIKEEITEISHTIELWKQTERDILGGLFSGGNSNQK